jgi:hypothetical protein
MRSSARREPHDPRVQARSTAAAISSTPAKTSATSSRSIHAPSSASATTSGVVEMFVQHRRRLDDDRRLGARRHQLELLRGDERSDEALRAFRGFVGSGSGALPCGWPHTPHATFGRDRGNALPQCAHTSGGARAAPNYTCDATARVCCG